jgi:8-oxo-dGTP pyrophosphatase MutT (NUDIX family)
VEEGIEEEVAGLADDLTEAPVVQAAGGVVWRQGGDGAVEVLLVHRPKYDDWSLPKGKLEAGETFEEAAAREVEEETGLQCRLGRELPGVRYRDRYDRPKIVRYWEMTVMGGRFRATKEVDVVRWLPVAEARRWLSYPHDRPVIESVIKRRAARPANPS